MNAPARFADPALPRHDWTRDEIEVLFDLPFTDLVFQAAGVPPAADLIPPPSGRPFGTAGG